MNERAPTLAEMGFDFDAYGCPGCFSEDCQECGGRYADAIEMPQQGEVEEPKT